MKLPVALAVLVAPALAAAEPPFRDAVVEVVPDPCNLPTVDPIVTPVRDVYLDAQRSACLRDEVSAGLDAHALIDTPGFHGVLGGDFSLGGRKVVTYADEGGVNNWPRLEVSAQVRVIDYAFVQNAVNKVTNADVGPLVLGAAAGKPFGESARGAVVLRVEVPYTRGERDTTRTSGELGGVVTGWLGLDRITLNARMSLLGMHASSTAGTTSRLAFRAGVDLGWNPGSGRPLANVTLQAGAELMAGWTHGLDDVLLRAGLHWAIHGGSWRLRTGVGAPVGGTERTNAIVDITLLHDL